MPIHARHEDISAAKEVLAYEPLTGNFRWLVKRNSFSGGVNPGDVAGTMKDGYVQIIANQRIWRAHRLAWAIMTGELPAKGLEIDHINGVRNDNSWTNLRLVTRRQNNQNMGLSRRNVSGVKGVSWNSRAGKWLANIKTKDRRVHLGYYSTVEEAAAARKAGEQAYHGEYARAA